MSFDPVADRYDETRGRRVARSASSPTRSSRGWRPAARSRSAWAPGSSAAALRAARLRRRSASTCHRPCSPTRTAGWARGSRSVTPAACRSRDACCDNAFFVRRRCTRSATSRARSPRRRAWCGPAAGSCVIAGDRPTGATADRRGRAAAGRAAPRSTAATTRTRSPPRRAAAGLRIVESRDLTSHSRGGSPNTVADLHRAARLVESAARGRRRVAPRSVVPAIERLRALPDPDDPRDRPMPYHASRCSRADDRSAGLLQPGGVEPAVDRSRGRGPVRRAGRAARPALCRPRSPRRRPAAVDSRCAIATVVRPRVTASSVRCSRTSVAGSTALVASSSTSRSGSATYARTSATSCRSPTLSASPRSPTGVCSPCGSPSHPVGQAQLGEGQLQVLVGQVGPGEADVLGDRRVEQEAVLRHHHHPAAQRREPHLGAAARRTAAPRRAVGSISRVSSLANVVLPLPVSPTTATRVRAAIVQVDVGEHRRARPDSAKRDAGRTGRRQRPGAAGRRPSSPGSATSGSMSSTSSTRRQPAIAFCASLSTSVAICTGWMNSVTRNRNAVSCADASGRRRRRAARRRPPRRPAPARPRSRRWRS